MSGKRFGWIIFILGVLSFLGGALGGFLSIGLLDDVLFDRDSSREVVLQESAVIIDTVEELEPSVVSIESEGGPQVDIFGREFETPSGAGTGVVVSGDGVVLTNRHVVPEESEITITTSDGTVYEDVEVIDRDPFIDIAYLQLETEEELKAVEIGDSDQVSVGQRVLAIGNALGEFSNTVTSGIISGIGRPIVARGQGQQTEQLQGLFQTDAAINPGNSGGPLVNIQGQVIGINTAVAGEAEGIGFAIPINQITAGLESIEEEGRLIKPFLGVRYFMLSPNIADEVGLEVDEGAYLSDDATESPIVEGSPADAAGLEAGDVITHVDGNEINRSNNLATALGRYRAGDEVELRYIRDGEEYSVDVELDEAPTDL